MKRLLTRMGILVAVGMLLSGCLTQDFSSFAEWTDPPKEATVAASTPVLIINATDLPITAFRAESTDGSFKSYTENVVIQPGEQRSFTLPSGSANLTVSLVYEDQVYDVAGTIAGAPGDEFEWEITEAMWVRPEDSAGSYGYLDGGYGYLDGSYGYIGEGDA